MTDDEPPPEEEVTCPPGETYQQRVHKQLRREIEEEKLCWLVARPDVSCALRTDRRQSRPAPEISPDGQKHHK